MVGETTMVITEVGITTGTVDSTVAGEIIAVGDIIEAGITTTADGKPGITTIIGTGTTGTTTMIASAWLDT
jgi:hypothetical protein